MSTPLIFGRDVQGYNAYAPKPSTNCYSATITSGSATSITVPSTSGVWIAAFSYQPGTNVWIDFTGATAAIPVGATLATTTSVRNPAARMLNAGTKISIITDNTSSDVGIELYAVSYP
jgi:hypothetical protein